MHIPSIKVSKVAYYSDLHLSRVMRKMDFCLCENNGYMDSTRLRVQDFVYKNKRECTITVAKTKALILFLQRQKSGYLMTRLTLWACSHLVRFLWIDLSWCKISLKRI